jgi:uncharacterized protein
MSAVDIVRKIYEAYARGDLEGSLAYCSDDVCLTLVGEPRLNAFAGRWSNKADFRQRLVELQETYEYRSFTPIEIFGDDNKAAAQTVIELTRRDNGNRFTLRCADVWTVRDGVATELIEYYDTALLAEMDGQPD